MQRDGVRRAVGVILAAQQSEAELGTLPARRRGARARRWTAPRRRSTSPPAGTPIRCSSTPSPRRRGTRWRRFPPSAAARPRLVFTAHSIPTAHGRRRRPTARSCATAPRWSPRASASREHTLAYQSRSGNPRDPWLEPDIDDVVRAHAARGARDLLVVPIGFVCDHVEVLYDLDVEARQAADGRGRRLRARADRQRPPQLHPHARGGRRRPRAVDDRRRARRARRGDRRRHHRPRRRAPPGRAQPRARPADRSAPARGEPAARRRHRHRARATASSSRPAPTRSSPRSRPRCSSASASASATDWSARARSSAAPTSCTTAACTPLPEGFLLLAPTRFWPLRRPRRCSPGRASCAWRSTWCCRAARGRRREPGQLRHAAGSAARRSSASRSRWSAASTPPIPTASASPRRCRASSRWSAPQRSLILAMWRQQRRAAARRQRRQRRALEPLPQLRRRHAAPGRPLAQRLPEGVVRLGQPVRAARAQRARAGASTARSTATPSSSPLPAHAAAGLLRAADAALADELAAIPYASSAIVTLAFRREDIPFPLDGFGFVVPARRAPRAARRHLQQRQVPRPRAGRVRPPARLRRRRPAARAGRARRRRAGDARARGARRPARRARAARADAHRPLAAVDAAVPRRPPRRASRASAPASPRSRACSSPATPTAASASPTASPAAKRRPRRWWTASNVRRGAGPVSP